jgi:hypothetical protein
MYFNIYVFRQHTILNCMVASIPEFNLLLISSWMQFWFVTVVPKYLKFVIFSKDVLATFKNDFFLYYGDEKWTYCFLCVYF